ncbi:DUF1077-domain-containing protein, partial [Schizophyllum commune]
MSTRHSLDYASLESNNKWRNLPSPPGFSKSTSTKGPSKPAASLPLSRYDELKEKRAWDFAIAPAKSLPMQAFMLYMSGGGIQIWNLGIVFMLMLGPLQALAKINQAFAPFAPSTAADTKATSTLLLQKLAYLACNLLTIGVGLWKCRSMGLLPAGTADWLPYETRGQVRLRRSHYF